MSETRKRTRGSCASGASKAPETSIKPFEVSHSKIKLARRCLKAYEYRYLRKLQKRIKSRPLIVGSLVHECLEMWFRDGHYTPAISAWKEKEFKAMFVEEQALHGDVIPLVKTLMRGYIKNWHDSGLEMEWVEKEFRVRIGDSGDPNDHLPDPGIWLVGKIDGKAREIKRPKITWLVEHKTCKKMPGEEVRIFDTQVLLYNAALHLIGEEQTNGVIWDYLRTKLPTKPALLTRGDALSVNKNIDTTREVYEREIRKHGFNVAGYQDILADLENKRDQFYRQIRLPMNTTMGQAILDEVVVTANLLIYLESIYRKYPDTNQHLFTRNLTRDCSWCDYSTLCHSELRGEDTDYLLKHDYIVRVKHADQEEARTVEVE